MKTKQIENYQYEYEIEGSLFMALGEFDRDVTEKILELMDNHVDDLPVKEGHVQVVAGFVHADTPCFFLLAYMNTVDAMTHFLSIDEISENDYLDYMAENKVFTQKPQA